MRSTSIFDFFNNDLRSYCCDVWKRIRKAGPFSMFFFLLLLTDQILFQSQTAIKEGWLLHFLCGVISTLGLLILLPSLFSNKWIRRFLLFLEVAILSFLFIYEYHLLTVCDTPITNSVMLHYQDPNISEIDPRMLFSGITMRSWLIGGFFPIIYGLIVFNFRKLVFFLSWINRTIGIRTILILFLFALFIVSFNKRSELYIITEETPYDKLNMPERFAVATKRALRESKSLEDGVRCLCSHPLGTKPMAIQRKPHNVVLILGESLRRQDMHCYGYPLENTPRLDSLNRTGRMTIYDDVVACGPNTNSSLQSALTYHRTEGGEGEWNDYPTLPLAFSDAGYYSYWNSNQEKSGLFIQIVSTIASTSDSVFYTSIQSTSSWIWDNKKQPYDEDVLPHLIDCEKVQKNLFEVVHLNGSHPFFAERYPSHFSKFKPDDIKESHLNNLAKIRSAEYMNSVYYNDFVIGEIIKRYEKGASIIIYLSDHGISRYDCSGNPSFLGHNNDKSSLQIPFIIYMSEQFMSENPDIVQAVREAQHKPFMSDLLTHSLVGLMGIRNQYSNPEWELWSPEYDVQRKRRIAAWGKETVFEPKYPQ